MALVKRNNCEITVPENRIEEYLQKGYSLIDPKGNVIRASMPQSIEDYKDLVASLNHQIRVKDARIAQLEAINRELKEQAARPEAPAPEAPAKAGKRTAPK